MKIKIIDQEDDYGSINEEEEVDNINFEESDEDLPIVVNEDEFIKQFKIDEKINKSPSPPRKIIQVNLVNSVNSANSSLLDNVVNYSEMDVEDDIVYRDKFGKRITRDQWLLLNQKKKQKQKEPKQELIWGKGLVQIKEKEQILQEEEKKINQNFQNYDIDEEYDEELRVKLRWNDPIDQNKIEKNEPKCRYNMVPNRFNIEPGYRWDGVIRGNNYEKRWFEARSIESAKNKQSYLNNISEL